MQDLVKVFALGGLDENGRDCYVVEINDESVAVINKLNPVPHVSDA